ncbi:hypothetical protein H5410_035751 [Solanum commersonii]|uniref:Uncharacterized protein n=1 Tax=Solanum commersonii TaxID=4109 RepID=A0A9J5Y3R2_SOLCO|nr:hypothetical protein H5410_035751 [Solanum commersonii]
MCGVGGSVPPAPAVPKGQNRRFGVKAVTKEGKETRIWLKFVMNCLILALHYTVISRDKLGDVERRYLLNDHAKVLLGILPEFHKPIDNDIPTDEERLRTSSDVESDSDEEIDHAQAGDKAEGGDAMED